MKITDEMRSRAVRLFLDKSLAEHEPSVQANAFLSAVLFDVPEPREARAAERERILELFEGEARELERQAWELDSTPSASRLGSIALAAAIIVYRDCAEDLRTLIQKIRTGVLEQPENKPTPEREE